MKKTLAYLRVSGLSQVEGEGLPRQKSAVEAFCKARELEIYGFFSEGGVSGTVEHEDRAQWTALLRCAQDTGINTVVVESAQRLARDILVAELLLRDAARRKIEIWDASTGEEIAIAPTSNPSRAFIRQVFAAVNQLDRALLTARLYDGKRRKNRWGGIPPVYTPENPAVQEIFRLKDEGLWNHEIVARLNEEKKFFRPNKKEWCRRTIFNILKGHGKTRKNGRRMDTYK